MTAAPPPNDNPRRTSANDEGLALVLALVFVVLLSALVVDFTYEMQVEASFVEAQETDLNAYLAAKSAVAAGMGVLAADVYLGEAEAANTETANQIYDSLDEQWAEGVPLAPLNDGVMQCTIEDEYGKLNLNALILKTDAGEERVNPRLELALRRLFEYRGDDIEFDRIVDGILDWLDEDDDTRPNGFENDYYTNLETPYNCKNGPMDNIEELLLIPGITPAVYFGDPEKEQRPLNQLLTVHGHPFGRINVNTADFAVLVAAFASDPGGCFPDPVSMAESVYEKLEAQGPFLNHQEIREFGLYCETEDPQAGEEGAAEEDQPPREEQSPLPPGERDFFEINSSTFRLLGDGQSAESRVRIEAYIWRDTSGIGQQQLFRVVDWRVIR